MTIWLWVGFLVLVLVLLALDLGVLNRRAHVIGIAEALRWTLFWIALALLFNVFIYFLYEHHWLGIGHFAKGDLNGRRAAVEFFTGYVVEKSLSLDNIFVIALIFAYFAVPRQYEHRTLFWGILGAIVLRGVMIVLGAALVQRFDWMIQVFGVLLLLTAVRMVKATEEHIAPDRNPLVKLARRFVPVSRDYEGERFFTRIDGRRAITPLFLVLLVIESTDVLFAVDSIPAIFGVTKDPFLVFTSNIFAILGLRSLYFALAGMIAKFKYMKTSLFLVLFYIAMKMLAEPWLEPHFHIEPAHSLLVILLILAVGLLCSLPHLRQDGEEAAEEFVEEADAAE